MQNYSQEFLARRKHQTRFLARRACFLRLHKLASPCPCSPWRCSNLHASSQSYPCMMHRPSIHGTSAVTCNMLDPTRPQIEIQPRSLDLPMDSPPESPKTRIYVNSGFSASAFEDMQERTPTEIVFPPG